MQLYVIFTCDFLETLGSLGFNNIWVNNLKMKKVLKDKSMSTGQMDIALRHELPAGMLNFDAQYLKIALQRDSTL